MNQGEFLGDPRFIGPMCSSSWYKMQTTVLRHNQHRALLSDVQRPIAVPSQSTKQPRAHLGLALALLTAASLCACTNASDPADTSGSDPSTTEAQDSPKQPDPSPTDSPSDDPQSESPGKDPSNNTQSPDPDSTNPLEGLNLDIDNLFNYQLQELPLYINQDNTPDDNPITDKGATLGRVLFYDPRLSTNNKISCASCHQQDHAFGDGRPLSDGVAGKTLRHSMRLVNIRFSEDINARWDRKADSVEAQMLMPVRDHVEMGYSGKDGNPDLDDLVKKLQSINAYKVLFKLAWGDPNVTKDRIAKSLAQFVRSIQSFDSKYDQGREKVSNDRDPFPNFTEDENAGKSLFLRDFRYEARDVEVTLKNGEKKTFAVSQRVSGGFNCEVCHRAPEFDIDPRSRNNGMTQAATPKAADSADYEAVRSASLRDLVNPTGKLNGGLFHTGQSLDLSGITDHYQFQIPDPDNYLLDRRFTRRDRPVHLNITETEKRQLLAFLRTLSGKQVYTDKRWSNPFVAP